MSFVMYKIDLEVIAFDWRSVELANHCHADRIELCASPSEGGTTPSHAMIKAAQSFSEIPISVMIRPRGGNFVYGDAEIKIMIDDIQYCKSVGISGVVFGALSNDDHLDVKHLKQLINASTGLEKTFHRAFDRVAKPIQIVQQLIDLGIDRILTSGQKKTAWEGRDLLKDLQNDYGTQIQIMAGSGINSSIIQPLIAQTGVYQIHGSFSKMWVENYGRNLENSGHISIDIDELKACQKIIQTLNE